MGRRRVLVCHAPPLLRPGLAFSRDLASAATGRPFSFHWRAFDEGLDPRGSSPKCRDRAWYQRARLQPARVPRATPPRRVPVSAPRAEVDPVPPHVSRRRLPRGCSGGSDHLDSIGTRARFDRTPGGKSLVWTSPLPVLEPPFDRLCQEAGDVLTRMSRGSLKQDSASNSERARETGSNPLELNAGDASSGSSGGRGSARGNPSFRKLTEILLVTAILVASIAVQLWLVSTK